MWPVITAERFIGKIRTYIVKYDNNIPTDFKALQKLSKRYQTQNYHTK